MISFTIWMAWFQGEHHLNTQGPPINRLAVRAWREMYPDNVILITDDNISQYAPNLRLIRGRSLNHNADLLRLHLLETHGGLWVDASCVPTKRIEEWMPLNDCFFTFRFAPRSMTGKGRRETVSWWIFARAHHPLITKWRERFEASYKRGLDRYFQLHDDLCTLYDSDSDVRAAVEGMTQISEKLPHAPPVKGRLQLNASCGVSKRPTGLDHAWYERLLKTLKTK